jgi:hypothetical protein
MTGLLVHPGLIVSAAQLEAPVIKIEPLGQVFAILLQRMEK